LRNDPGGQIGGYCCAYRTSSRAANQFAIPAKSFLPLSGAE
jgi:hypothetical protein